MNREHGLVQVITPQQMLSLLFFLAPGRSPLTYSHLYRHINDVVQTLHVMGLGRDDRVALVLPNGPEMAVAFLAVAASATCAPLNPAYSTPRIRLLSC